MVERENWWPALVTHTGPKELNTDESESSEYGNEIE